MVEYSKVNVKSQLKKLNTDVKNNSGTTVRMSFKKFDRNDLPHELLLTIRQRKKIRNEFNNNRSTDMKISEDQVSKRIQSARFLGSLLSKLVGPLIKIVVSFYVITIRRGFNSSCFSNWCRNLKENKWPRNNNFNNSKRINEWHIENCSDSWRL